MKIRKLFNKLILIVFITMVIICINSFHYKSNAEIQFERGNTASNDREPRIILRKTNKDNYVLLLHDNTGINLSKTTVTFDGKKVNLTLIETTNTNSENTGVYNKDGKRIKDLPNSNNYNGKRYDYGLKISKSSLSNTYKNISIVAYDYEGKCYLRETLKAKKLDKVNKSGEQFHTDRAPRVTVKNSNGIVQIYAEDNSGIKNLKVLSSKTNEVLFNWSANSTQIAEGVINSLANVKQNGTTSNGYMKNGVLYPYKLSRVISYEKAKIADNKYKIKVIAEDVSGIKSEKTMMFSITAEVKSTNTGNNSGNSSTGSNNTGNSSTGSNNTGNSSTGSKNSGNNSSGSNKGNSSTGSNNSGNSSSGSNKGNSSTGSNNSGNNSSGSNKGNGSSKSNNSGNSNSKEFDFKLSKTNIETKTGKAQSYLIKITGYSDKYNGKKVNFSVKSSNTKVASAGLYENNDIKINTCNGYGNATVTVTAYIGFYKELKTKEIHVKVVKDVIPATSIRIEPDSNGIITMKLGSTIKFKAIVTPSNTTEKVEWYTSKDKSIVVDDNGNVTAKKLTDYTTLNAKCGNALTYVSIRTRLLSGLKEGDKPVSSIKLSDSKITLKKGQSKKIKATAFPKDATNKNVVWSVGVNNLNYITLEDKNISVSKDGTVTAKKPGTSEVIAIATDGSGVYGKCIVNVVKNPVKNIKLKNRSNNESVESEIAITKDTVLEAKIEPSDATFHDIKVNSSNSSIVEAVKYSWDKGGIYLTPKKQGAAIITISTEDFTRSITVIVGSGVNDKVNTKNIKIDKKSYNIELRVDLDRRSLYTEKRKADLSKKYSSKIKCIFKYGPNGGLIYSGYDKDGYFIEGVGIGIFDISVVYYLSQDLDLIVAIDTYHVTVKSKSPFATKVIPVTKVSFDSPKLTLVEGEEKKLKVTVSPQNASNKDIEWRTSDYNVAGFTSGGVVGFNNGRKIKAKKEGSAQIKVTAIDGSNKSAICNVKVISKKQSSNAKTSMPVSYTGKKVESISLKYNNKIVKKINVRLNSLNHETKSFTLSAAVSPKNATNTKLIWLSSDNKVAQVNDSGKVTLRKIGETTILAGALDGSKKSGKCHITVWQPVTWISISNTNITLKNGESKELSATAYPTYAKNRKLIKWSSSNPSVASVNENTGKVTAHKRGEATITAKVQGEYSRQCKVTVTQPVEYITLNKSGVSVKKGKTYKLKATVHPDNANCQTIKWETSNKKYAKIEKGKITGKKIGNARIRAYVKDSINGDKVHNAYCSVAIVPIKVKSVNITTGDFSLNLGQSRKVYCKVKPSDATNKDIKWKSSKPNYVSVDGNGKVKAKKYYGSKIKITAKSTDGTNKKSCCYVRVKAKTQSSNSGYNSSTKQRSRGNVSW